MDPVTLQFDITIADGVEWVGPDVPRVDRG